MHPIQRKILIVVLGLGTVLGYAHGFRALRHHRMERRAHFEEHVAKACAEAAIDRARK